MTIDGRTPAPGLHPMPSLDAYRKAAEQSDAVVLSLDGEDWQVHGSGHMPGTGRKVSWVRSESARVDTTSAFTDELNNSFGHDLGTATKDALNLRASPGKPLSSRMVKKAIDMATTGQQVLTGVDFLTRTLYSASLGGSEFKRTCLQQGINPDSVSAADRTLIDKELDARFKNAHANGQIPVTPGEVNQWLQEALKLAE